MYEEVSETGTLALCSKAGTSARADGGGRRQRELGHAWAQVPIVTKLAGSKGSAEG